MFDRPQWMIQRVSTSTNASMLACGSCRPRITTTSVRDGSTLSGQTLRPEEPETPKISLFQGPLRGDVLGPLGARFQHLSFGYQSPNLKRSSAFRLGSAIPRSA